MSTTQLDHDDDTVQLVAAGLVRLLGTHDAAEHLVRVYGHDKAMAALEGLVAKKEALQAKLERDASSITRTRKARRHAVSRMTGHATPTPFGDRRVMLDRRTAARRDIQDAQVLDAEQADADVIIITGAEDATALVDEQV